MSFAEKVLAAIQAQPGRKAMQIAKQLGVDKKQVNAVLYGALKGKVRQDSRYCWHPVESGAGQAGSGAGASGSGSGKDTPLAHLCRYYLDCLAQGDEQGISVFAADRHGNPDYAELETLPGLSDDEGNQLLVDGADIIYRKVRQSRGNQVLYMGYPVRLRKHRAPSGWEGFFMEPLLLWSVETDGNGPRVADEYPIFNFRALKSLASGGDTNHLEESAALNDELGLDASPGDVPDTDELISRLRLIRPEWDWQEDMDAFMLSSGDGLDQIQVPGIYNRAVLVAGERSPFTRGLESELKQLMALDESAYQDTALGQWLSHMESPDSSDMGERDSIIEVIPLNLEQRESIHSGLVEPLTVITGPPGTGKSQVVTGLLTNAAWTGKRVLFASKNNKAVDVVHDRVNGLASSPTLLRLGSNDKQFALAEHLLGLLATKNTADDEAEYQQCLDLHERFSEQLAEIDADVKKVLEARNTVDKADRIISEYRSIWGEEVFVAAAGLDVKGSRVLATNCHRAIKRADRDKQGLLRRAVWRFTEAGRQEKLRLAIQRAELSFRILGLEIHEELSLEEKEAIATEFDKRLDVSDRIQEYRKSLSTLGKLDSFEDLAARQFELNQKIARNSESLWKTWVDLQPSRLGTDERRALSNYATVLQSLIEVRGEDRKAQYQILRRYYKLFPEISHLLPCWAVTSLSARGKVPFVANFFELLIVDEASQCDIASALPLLYRAKRAVVIGDPQQLRHISAVPVGKDYLLQEKHGISDEYSSWTYSVNSLFQLAAGMVPTGALVNLRDHHRSHADIIGFSNQYFYKGRLRVATAYDRLNRPASDEPAVLWDHVIGEVRRPAAGGAVNELEAQALVHALQALLSRGYTGTIGAVTPFRAQANRIRELINRDDELAQLLGRADFLVDTVHRFQGDERDVMFFSPVVSVGIAKGAIGFLRSNGNLFNVAITRARAVLHVVGDRQAAIQSGVGYLKEFAEYVANLDQPNAGPAESIEDLGPGYPAVSHPERVSDWERIFYKKMYAAGIRPIPQYDIEQYTLDFALFDGDRKLNIEVDGERYHKDWTGELCRRDQLRNQRLIELGWEVKRFWVYQIRDEMPECIDWVRTWINKNGLN